MDMQHVGPISKYCWIIYISQAHCHFVKTGAHITFKARPGFEIKKWGLRIVFNRDVQVMREEFYSMSNQGDGPCFSHLDKSFWPILQQPHYWLLTQDVYESSSSSGPKIRLPYNWFATEEEEKENMDAKAKENNLYNLGRSSIEEEEDKIFITLAVPP